MSKKPIVIKGYESSKIRPKQIEISLSKKELHRLPRIAQANEAWVADEHTAEIELETTEGQRVIVPLSGYAIENLAELTDQLLQMKNTDKDD